MLKTAYGLIHTDLANGTAFIWIKSIWIKKKQCCLYKIPVNCVRNTNCLVYDSHFLIGCVLDVFLKLISTCTISKKKMYNVLDRINFKIRKKIR